MTLLAISTPIYENNNVMMSESLSISSLVLFIAIYLQLIRRRMAFDLKLLLLSLIWISGTKQSYSMLAPIILLFIFIQFKDLVWRVNKYFLAFIVAFVCWNFFMIFSTHGVSDYNLVALVYYRFSYVPAWLEWWKSGGFPVEILGIKDFGSALGNPLTKSWLASTSNFELIKFYMSFPALAVFGVFILPAFSSAFNWENTGSGAIFAGTRLTDQLKLDDHELLNGFWPTDYFYSVSNLWLSFAFCALLIFPIFTLALRGINFRFSPYIPLGLLLYCLLEINFLLGPFDFPRIFVALSAISRVLFIYIFCMAVSKHLKHK
jgi:hypothetical protein